MTDIVETLYSYAGGNGFDFEAGEKINVQERGDNGWWRGTLLDSTDGKMSEKEGWFPSSYVEKRDNLNTSV